MDFQHGIVERFSASQVVEAADLAVKAARAARIPGLVVLSDACADADPEVHRVLTEKVFPRQAQVTTTGEWISAL
jgi:hypothetical protein